MIQFLIVLRSDFERLRGSILHRSPLLSADSIVNQLLAEEICVQCPNLRQQNQVWKSGSQSQSNAHTPPNGYKPPHHNTAAGVSSGSITDSSTQVE